MKKFLAIVIVVPALTLGALYLLVLYEGPRMTEQPHVRSFQAVLPQLPPGTVTVGVPVVLPTAAQAAALANPLPVTRGNLEAGRLYYRYYCVFCHGERGDGNGPVGQSYQPVPADLRSTRVSALSDGELLRRMLVGTGHEPVLERVVKPRHRWPLVLFVRSLAVAR